MKQQLNEEFRRMQKLAGIVNEDIKPSLVGTFHPSAVYPFGMAWHDLSTGTSVDIGEDPNHGMYPKLTPEEHKEVIDILTNYLIKYEKNFKNTPEYNPVVVQMAKHIIKKHQELVGSLNENSSIIVYNSKGNSEDELYKIENLPVISSIKDIPQSILDKIGNHEEIELDGDFSSPGETSYAHITSDGLLVIVDSLDKFDNGFKSEEEWGVEGWTRL